MYKSVGKKKMQKIYEGMFHLSLSGMNYGNGGDFNESGELAVLTSIKDHFKNEEKLTVFDVGGNKFRIIARIIFTTRTVFIRFVGTHKEYDEVKLSDL